MRLTVPDYYEKFICLADKCRDNCCIGWEIPIDDETLDRYRGFEGNFGNALKSGITDRDGFHCFKHRGDGRCVFLDSGGLCEIIQKLGDGALCQICRDHPRYFNVIGDECEGGLGLACEEAARIILSQNMLPCVTVKECDAESAEADGKALALMRSARDRINTLIFDRSISIREAISRLNEYAITLDSVFFDLICGINDVTTTPDVSLVKTLMQNSDIRDWLEVFSTLEAFDEKWNYLLERARVGAERADLWNFINGEAEGYARALLYYFIHRYFLKGVYEADIIPRIKLAISSTLLILSSLLSCGDPTTENVAMIAKDFSKSVEYSTENIELLLGAL